MFALTLGLRLRQREYKTVLGHALQAVDSEQRMMQTR
jgi:hypothetical protein